MANPAVTAQIDRRRAPTLVPPAAGAPRRARRTGRPPKLTRARGDALLADRRAGLSRRAAARRAGIHEDTLRRWLRRGEAQDLGMHADFCGAIKKAEAEFMLVALEAINAGHAAWTYYAHLLERYYPEDWGLGAGRRRQGRK